MIKDLIRSKEHSRDPGLVLTRLSTISCGNTDNHLMPLRRSFPWASGMEPSKVCHGVLTTRYVLFMLFHTAFHEMLNHPARPPSTSPLSTAAAQENDLVRAHCGTRFLSACGGHADQVKMCAACVQNAAGVGRFLPPAVPASLSESRSAVVARDLGDHRAQ